MMTYKTLTAFFLVIVSFVSCKRIENAPLPGSNNNHTTPLGPIVLQPLVISGNHVTLNWTKLDSSQISSYCIVKCTDTMLEEYPYIDTIVVTNTLNSYVDSMPFDQYAQYFVIAKQPGINYGLWPVSNKQTCVKAGPNTILMNPVNALYDKSSHYLYVFGTNNNIVLYDVFNKQILQQISTNATTMGHGDVGTYNGTRELYVPRYDGWIYIYDATTLSLIDQVNVGGDLWDVTYNNGVLFVSALEGNVSSYSRQTKTQISQKDIYLFAPRMKLIPGTNSKFWGLDEDNIVAFNISFDAMGNYDSTRQLSENSHYVGAQTFAVYADGSGFISGSKGNIFNSDLSFKSSLQSGNLTFTNFDLDDAGRVIYGAVYNNKIIQGYSMDNYQLSRTINTQGYPFNIFYDNGSVICLSTFYPNQQDNNLNPYCRVDQY